MKRWGAFVLLVAAVVALVAAAADQGKAWLLKKNDCQLKFWVRHLGVQNVEGAFGVFDAKVIATEDGRLTQVTATVQASSVHTGSQVRDSFLRGEDFFQSAKFPQIVLTTKRIEWSGQHFVATSDLTIRNVTKPIEARGTIVSLQPSGNTNTAIARYRVTARLDRRDFHLVFNQIAEATALVADHIDIEVDVQTELPRAPTESN